MGNNDEHNNLQEKKEKGANNKVAIILITTIIAIIFIIITLSINLVISTRNKNTSNNKVEVIEESKIKEDIKEEEKKQNAVPEKTDKEVFDDILIEDENNEEDDVVKAKPSEKAEERENNIFISNLDLDTYRVEEVNENRLYPFYNEDYMYGYKDENGEVIIEPIYDYAGNFSEGYAYVFNESEGGYIDLEGNMILDIDHYCFGYEFSNGLAVLEHMDAETTITDGYIVMNENGDEIVSGAYDYIFIDNAGFIECSLNRELIYYDMEGRLLEGMDDLYVIQGFVNGYAIVEEEHTGIWYLIDTDYNIIDVEGYELTDYFNGLSEYYSEELDEYVYLNEQLDIIELRDDIYRLWYYNYGDEIAYGISIDDNYNKSYIYVDNQGNELFTSQYEIQESFIDGFASVYYYDESYNFYEGVMDVKGNLIELEESVIEVLNNSKVIVSNDKDLWGIKDINTGKMIVDHKYYFIEVINNIVICSLYNEEDETFWYDVYSLDGDSIIENTIDDYFAIDSKIICCINYIDDECESYYLNTETKKVFK